MGDTEKHLTQWEKSENLNWAVLYRSPGKLERYFKKLGKVDFTANALGLACRCRGVEWVKVLVKLGAEFRYDPDELERISGHEFRAGVNYAMMILRKPQFNNYNQSTLSIFERLEVLEYLLETADKTGFDKNEILFYATVNCELEIADRLRKAGAEISQKFINAITDEKISEEIDAWSYEKWIDFCVMTYHLSDEEYMACMPVLAAELHGRKFRYGGWIRDVFSIREKTPGFYAFFFENFNVPDREFFSLMRSVINTGSAEGLAAAAERGFLNNYEDCRGLIEYSAEKGKTECTAFLLNHLNQNFNNLTWS